VDRQRRERALLEAFFRPLGDPASVDAGSPPLAARRTPDRSCSEVEARFDADPTIPAVRCAALLPADLANSRVERLERAFHDLLGVSPAHHLRLRSLNAVREGSTAVPARTRHCHPYRHRQRLLAPRPLLPILPRPVRRAPRRYAATNGPQRLKRIFLTLGRATPVRAFSCSYWSASETLAARKSMTRHWMARPSGRDELVDNASRTDALRSMEPRIRRQLP